MPNIRVRPPLKGIVRSTAFQQQEPFSLSEATNFLPFDPFSGRAMMATRPFQTAWDTPGNAGTLGVNFLMPLNGTSTESPQQTLLAAVNGTLYWWDGTSAFNTAGGSGTIVTNRAIFGTPFLAKAIICANTGAPLVYNYPTDTLSTLTASAGSVPLDARVCTTWQNSVILAGRPAEPYTVYFSRTGDETDWDHTVADTDEAGAFQLASDTEGQIGEPVTAAVPFTDDSLIIGGAAGLWEFRGHPRRGGTFNKISSSVGIIGQGAWTLSPDGILWFMALDGLYAYPPGGAPTPVSPNIPIEFRGLTFDTTDPVCNIEYDTRFGGVHIFYRGDDARAWWYDIKTGSFWGLRYDFYPTVTTRFDPIHTGRASPVVSGGPGFGGLSRWDLDGASETGWAYGAKLGPIRISPNQRDKGRVREVNIAASLTNNDTDAEVSFYVGATGEDAYGRCQAQDVAFRSAVTSGTLINNAWRHRPRCAGHALVVEIIGSDSTSSHMQFETMDLDVEAAGRNSLAPTFNVSEVPASGGLIGVGRACLLASHGAGAAFDGSAWTGYATHTDLIAQSGDYLVDMTYLVDLSQMPSGFWTAVDSTGKDIRVTDSHDVQLAYDLIAWDHGSQTGTLGVRIPECYRQIKLRIYAGNASATAPTAGSTYGQNNTYDSDCLVCYPNGAGVDRTGNSIDQTLTNATEGDVAGPYTYLSGTDFEANDSNSATATASVTSTTTDELTVLEWTRIPTVFTPPVGEADFSDSSNNSIGGYAYGFNTFSPSASATITLDQQFNTAPGRFERVNLLSSRTTSYHHFAYTVDAVADIMELYFDGVSQTTIDTGTDATTITIDDMNMGVTRTGLAGQTLNLYRSSFWVYDVELPSSFVVQHRSMHDPTFYGTWSWKT